MRVQVVFALAFSLIADFTVAKNCKYSGWQKKMVCDDEPAGTKGKAYLATPGSSKSGKGGDGVNGGSISLKKAMGKTSSGSGGGFGGKKDKGHHQRTARTDEMRLEVYDSPSRPPRTSQSKQ